MSWSGEPATPPLSRPAAFAPSCSGALPLSPTTCPSKNKTTSEDVGHFHAWQHQAFKFERVSGAWMQGQCQCSTQVLHLRVDSSTGLMQGTGWSNSALGLRRCAVGHSHTGNQFVNRSLQPRTRLRRLSAAEDDKASEPQPSETDSETGGKTEPRPRRRRRSGRRADGTNADTGEALSIDKFNPYAMGRKSRREHPPRLNCHFSNNLCAAVQALSSTLSCLVSC